MKSRDDIIKRIRKLMRIARDGSASEGEVENALRFARALMDRFAIHEQDVSDDTLTDSERMDKFKISYGFNMSRSIPLYDQMLSAAVMFVCDVGACTYRSQIGRGRRVYITFYGPESDVAIAHALFAELRKTMRAFARRRFGSGWNVRHRSYCRGFASRLSYRARKLSMASTLHHEHGAIILHRRALLERFGEERFGLDSEPKTATLPETNCMDATRLGQIDGGRVSLAKNGLPHNPERRPKELEA